MLFARISEELERLRPSERRVAEFVLARPTVAADMTIADLAAEVGVSEPTVMRFCRAAGLKGFQDMKRQVLRNLEQRKAVAAPLAEPLATVIGSELVLPAQHSTKALPDVATIAEVVVRQAGIAVLALDSEFEALAEASHHHLAAALGRAGVLARTGIAQTRNIETRNNETRSAGTGDDHTRYDRACLELGDSGGGQLVRLVGAPAVSGLGGQVAVLLNPPGANLFERYRLVIGLIDAIADHMTSKAGASLSRQAAREQAFARSRALTLSGLANHLQGGPGAQAPRRIAQQAGMGAGIGSSRGAGLQPQQRPDPRQA
jgi:hypothetical protein